MRGQGDQEPLLQKRSVAPIADGGTATPNREAHPLPLPRKSAGERIEWDDPVAADTAWENLREEDRQQNLSQARSIPKKLELVGLEVADKSYDQRIRFTQAEIEILAADEHQRWMAVKANQGYRYGKTRSDIPPRRHPDLRSYESLEDKTKEFDRRIARMLPTWLQRVGLGVRRRHP